MKFTLDVAFGNEAMQNGSDLAGLLRELANKVDEQDQEALTGGVIRDLNGNTVGRWDIQD